MKRFAIILTLAALAVVAACSKSESPSNPGYGMGGGGGVPTPTSIPGTPTATPAATVTTNANTFGNPNVTIAAGQSVKWTIGSGHTLVIDDGTGTCVSGVIGGSTTYQQAFPSTGTFSFHCTVHSSCTTGSVCTGCTGMVGSVTVNP